jgi:glyoxylase-like metal-dependent hydrolase (beta-lactamase superfamily II)
MLIHHLNCASLNSYWPRVNSLVYCLLVESDDGLVLVDTGFGTQDSLNPTPLVRLFTAWMGCPRDIKETAIWQVEKLGYKPADVKHIVMTHLHIDHAGGLPDFPDAAVHIHREEYDAAMKPRGFIERFYVQAHWAHGPRWVIHDWQGETWYDINSITIQQGLKPAIHMLPLPGHSRGHCAVAIQKPGGWLLHCGDSTYPFYHDGHPNQPIDSPPGWLVRGLLGPHTPRLRALAEDYADEIQMVCSHDPVSYSQNRLTNSVAQA